MNRVNGTRLKLVKPCPLPPPCYRDIEAAAERRRLDAAERFAAAEFGRHRARRAVARWAFVVVFAALVFATVLLSGGTP